MPQSPNVTFNFHNDNVADSTPLLGVSHVVANTTKGPYKSPTTVIKNYAQFQSIFGEEIVPDGSISNIKKALELGSLLRISRVEPTSASKGNAVEGSYNSATKTVSPASDGATTIEISFKAPGSEVVSYVNLKISTLNCGDPSIGDSQGRFSLTLQKSNRNYILYQTKSAVLSGQTSTPIYLFPISLESDGSTVLSSDGTYLKNWVNNPNQYGIEVNLDKTSTVTNPTSTGFNNIQDVVNLLNNFKGYKDVTVKVGSTTVSTSEKAYLYGTIGVMGDVVTLEEWIAGVEAFADYNDAYQMIVSHVHQYTITSSVTPALTPQECLMAIHSSAKNLVGLNFTAMYFIEIPKYSTGTTPRSAASQITWANECQQTLGYSKQIAYFGGGLKYKDEYGNTQDCDVLGSVIGLADISASANGPWYSFSGMNRGVLPNAIGLVSDNYGTPTRYSELNPLAENYINEMVIKDTPTMGKKVMLWHGFTSTPENSSYKFISIVRLCLFLKKNFEPILWSYIEEPNTFSTWMAIYYKVVPIIDRLVTEKAMIEPQWLGDQFANSFSDCTVNNEADVRQGKYRAIFKFKDIVPLQDITLNINIDKTSGTISINDEGGN